MGGKRTSDTLAVARASGRFSRNVQTVLVERPIATKETGREFALHINGALLESGWRNFNFRRTSGRIVSSNGL